MGRGANKGAYVAALAALLVVLSVAGCGGSGRAETVSKSEFVKQANTICKDATKKRGEAVSAATGGAEPPTVQLVTDTILPMIQKMAEELGDLKAPAGEEKEVQAIVSAINSAVKKVEANAEDSSLAEDVAAFRHADQLAEEYGLTGCRI